MRSFRLHIVIRVLALLLAMTGLLYAWQASVYAVGLISILAIVLLTIELIRYAERGSRDLGRFLLSIKHQDHTQRFTPDGRGSAFDTQREAQNAIMAEFQRLRAEKEAHHLYLQTVIKHVQVALLCVNEQGEIILMNPAAKDLLAKPHLHTLSSLEPAFPELTEQLENLQPGERTLAKVVVKGEMAQLALACTAFKLQDEPFRLLSMQNIQAEMEAQEFEAWHKLIRVLTHEIMNSVTPIIALATSAHETVQQGFEPEDHQDLEDSLEVIARRSKGIQHFVQAYRNLTQLPQPQFQEVELGSICKQVALLMEPDLAAHGISLNLELQEKVIVKADSHLIEQVLINLVKNAKQAVSVQQQPEISLITKQGEEGQAQVLIRDNGPGIPSEILPQIFIPFFTTKDQGSGIGLSLSRQIMRLHHGRISVMTEEGEGTTFVLGF